MMRALLLVLASLIGLQTLGPVQLSAREGDEHAAGIFQSNTAPAAPTLWHLLMSDTRKTKRAACEPGQNRDPETGVCFSCSHNDHFENGKCVPCKAGFHEDGDECVADAKVEPQSDEKTCPKGKHFDKGKCRKIKSPSAEQTGECNAGQARDPETGICFNCARNEHVENGKCVAGRATDADTRTCPQGREFRNGKCRRVKAQPAEETAQCEPGQERDPQTGVCFSCSHNDHFENGKCVPCQAGFHVEGDQCVAD
jgi:hypothetical protein